MNSPRLKLFGCFRLFFTAFLNLPFERRLLSENGVYRTPEELFDEFLDSVYAAEGCGSIAQDGSQRLPS